MYLCSEKSKNNCNLVSINHLEQQCTTLYLPHHFVIFGCLPSDVLFLPTLVPTPKKVLEGHELSVWIDRYSQQFQILSKVAFIFSHRYVVYLKVISKNIPKICTSLQSFILHQEASKLSKVILCEIIELSKTEM